MNPRLLALALALSIPVLAHAQYAVNDAATQALISQGNSNFLQQMSTQFDKLNQQITQLQQIQSHAQQLVTIAGNPAAALSFASGAMGLDTSSLLGSSLFRTADSIASTVDGARSLANNAGGVFQAIPSTTANGLTVVRDLASYKKFDAFEQNLGAFQSVLRNGQWQRQQLLSQLQTVMNTPASTQAEQSEKIARVNALSAQLHSNDQTIRDANEQRQAQNEANTQDAAKQKQATQERLNTEFNQAQAQADKQADSALSGIVNQKP